jgi:hypothetical protein
MGGTLFMARISEYVDDNWDMSEDTKTCMFCGEHLEKGGFWVGEKEVGCCKECAPWLIALFLDTMLDYGELDLSKPMDTYEKVKGYCKKQINKKTGLLMQNLKRQSEER